MFSPTQAPQDPQILQLVEMMSRACEILREEYQNYCAGAAFEIEQKSDASPVTQADYRVNRYMTEALAQLSDLPLLSEEGEASERQQWSTFWLLDPLDGTKEFLHQRPEFTINLSLVKGSETVLAFLAIPAQNVMYLCAEQGLPLKFEIETAQWSIYQHNDAAEVVQIGLSQSSQHKPQYADYLAAMGQLSAYSEFKAGSAYKFCMILEDQVDIYPRFHPTCEWDTSAGQCLIERIGGGLIDLRGRRFIYNQRDTLLNAGFIAYRNNAMKNLALQALELMSNKP